MVKFVIVFIFAFIVVSLASLVWPLITTQARPAVLSAVRQHIIQTPAGAQIAQVLGVSDESAIVPISAQSVALTVSQQLTQAAKEKTQDYVVSRVTTEIARQYETLSVDQKNELQQIICQP